MNTRHISSLTIEGEVLLRGRDGDVVVKGGMGRGATIIGVARVEQEAGRTVIEAEDSVILTLPSNVPLTIGGPVSSIVMKEMQSVTVEECHGNVVGSHLGTVSFESDLHGDAVLRQVEGDLHLKELHGDLAIHGAGAVRFGFVHGDAALHDVGDVSGEGVAGDLSISQAGAVELGHVSGDVALSRLSGALLLSHTDGDLAVSDPGPAMAVAYVSGAAALSGELEPNGEYSLQAQGDVWARVDGNVHFVVRAAGALEVDEGMEQEDAEDGTTHVTLGEREDAAHVTIQAEGDVHLNVPRPRHERRHHRHRHRHRHHGPWGEMDPEVWAAMREAKREARRAKREVKREMKRFKHLFRHEFERAFGEGEAPVAAGEAIGEAVRTTVQELLSALRPPTPTRPTSSPPPSSSPPPTEELEMILEMVEAGTITPEEAEALIAAME